MIIYFNNILIYTQNKNKGHLVAVEYVLNLLKKYKLFANLKKY